MMMQRGDEPADLFMVSSDSSDGVIVTQDRTPSGFENYRNVERFNDNCPGEGGSNLVVIAEERNEKLGASVPWTLKTRKRKTPTLRKFSNRQTASYVRSVALLP
jgi:hypothetical protein